MAREEERKYGKKRKVGNGMMEGCPSIMVCCKGGGGGGRKLGHICARLGLLFYWVRDGLGSDSTQLNSTLVFLVGVAFVVVLDRRRQTSHGLCTLEESVAPAGQRRASSLSLSLSLVAAGQVGGWGGMVYINAW